MTQHAKTRVPGLAALGLFAIAGAVALPAASAFAGDCPAGKVVADGQRAGATKHKGVTDKVIGSIDLAQEAPRLKDHKFRLRRLVVQPGGEVAWHSHGERPAIIYIVSGTITEYRSTCAVPIVHKAGDVAPEVHTTSHWWKNTSSRPAVLLSADILHEKSDPHTM
jgi:quercetin dioxygenase-like cupin family protein